MVQTMLAKSEHKSKSAHRLFDPVLESPFSLLEVVLALVHRSKVTVVCKDLRNGVMVLLTLMLMLMLIMLH